MLRYFLLILSALVITTSLTITQAANITLQTENAIELKQTNIDESAKLNKLYKEVNALQLVESPAKYMDKPVKIKAIFDKFSAIGLDYEPASRSSKDYISILIKRENVLDYNIPLSELKLIIERTYAEKELVNIETGDEIIIYGKVFCLALGDPWVNVDKIEILTIKDKEENKEDKNKLR